MRVCKLFYLTRIIENLKRLNPMYVRADSAFSQSKGAEIDELLEEHHPRALRRRVSSMEVPKK